LKEKEKIGGAGDTLVSASELKKERTEVLYRRGGHGRVLQSDCGP